jgi:hypothetical protein
MWLTCILLHIGLWAFTAVIASLTHRQDPESYIVWDTESFVFVGFFWPLFLPPLLVRQAVRYWTNK